MKKVFGAAALGVVAVLALASSAGALVAVDPDPSTPAPSPGPCVFNVTPTGSTTFPVIGAVVSGTAPAGVTAILFLDGVPQGVTQNSPQLVGAGGTFSFPNVTVASSSTAITVNYTYAGSPAQGYGPKNAYTTICASPLGDVVIRVKAEAATLAFTGSSSNTPTYVLVGFAAIVLGLVMVVGVRRRASVRG
jgi:LPXTG-motif cell wall-anchored protein